MTKDELRKMFEDNVTYLQRVIPPDDIYPFAEETFMAALYFIQRWSQLEDLGVLCESDPIAKKWIMNIMGFLRARDLKLEMTVDLGLEEIDEGD